MKPRIDFEEGDVLAVEDKVEMVTEECIVVSNEKEDIWSFRTNMDRMIRYNAKKAENANYRYQILAVLTDGVKK